MAGRGLLKVQSRQSPRLTHNFGRFLVKPILSGAMIYPVQLREGLAASLTCRCPVINDPP